MKNLTKYETYVVAGGVSLQHNKDGTRTIRIRDGESFSLNGHGFTWDGSSLKQQDEVWNEYKINYHMSGDTALYTLTPNKVKK